MKPDSFGARFGIVVVLGPSTCRQTDQNNKHNQFKLMHNNFSQKLIFNFLSDLKFKKLNKFIDYFYSRTPYLYELLSICLFIHSFKQTNKKLLKS